VNEARSRCAPGCERRTTTSPNASPKAMRGRGRWGARGRGRARAGQRGAGGAVRGALPRPLRRPCAPGWPRRKGTGRRGINAAEAANGLQRAPRCARPSTRLSSRLRSPPFSGSVPSTTTRLARCERPELERRGARATAKRRVQCGGTRPPGTARSAGSAGGWRVPINPVSRDHVHKPCWRTAVHIWGRAGWAGLPGRPLSLTPMDVPRDAHAPGRLRLWSIAWRVLTPPGVWRTSPTRRGRSHARWALGGESPARNGTAHGRALPGSVARRHPDGHRIAPADEALGDAVTPSSATHSGDFRLCGSGLYEVGGSVC
jgi:hypothetical protein